MERKINFCIFLWKIILDVNTYTFINHFKIHFCHSRRETEALPEANRSWQSLRCLKREKSGLTFYHAGHASTNLIIEGFIERLVFSLGTRIMVVERREQYHRPLHCLRRIFFVKDRNVLPHSLINYIYSIYLVPTTVVSAVRNASLSPEQHLLSLTWKNNSLAIRLMVNFCWHAFVPRTETVISFS